MQPDILVTAPMPPFLYEPLKSSYRCHDYYKAEDKPGNGEAATVPEPASSRLSRTFTQAS